MINDLTLVIMAAGKGSRYGGSKQTDSLGLCGESIMDFSIFDGCLAGFNKFVFIVQKSQLEYFKEKYQKLAEVHEVRYAIQDPEVAPFETKGFVRSKPWGTTHACWSAKAHIHTPFCILNADDYYGRSTFFKMADFLRNNKNQDRGAFVAYKLRKTMSEHGSVSRGICKIQQGELKSIQESLSIELVNDLIIAENEVLDPQTLVSMNIWGLTPKLFELLEARLKLFGENLSREDLDHMEALLPADIQSLIDQNLITVQPLYADEDWFGITYQKDRELASFRLCELQKCGFYPTPLFSQSRKMGNIF